MGVCFDALFIGDFIAASIYSCHFFTWLVLIKGKKENEFQVKDHNMDTDSHTWRPMKIDNNGDLKPVVSELLSNKTLKIISDTWFPNSISLKERD